ncbi:cyclase family protein [Celeribacter sp.]|uniref:cyclase family protein n=1 Tax=Celeribacter sp. TaxID=1890673 RepID=UPI003A945FD3
MDILKALGGALGDGSVRIVDLTRTLSPDDPTIVMPPELGQSWGVKIERISRYDGDGPAWYWNNLSFGEHTGTHFDAPVHWVTGRDLPNNTVDTMPTEPMLAPVCVIDCTPESAADSDFLLTVAHIEAWEAERGVIPAGAWVFMRTGWSHKTGADYANLQSDGAHTPGPDADAVQFLVNERNVIGLGTETIGTDCGQAGHMNPPYPAHHFLHGAGKYGLQCLANLEALPLTGALVFAAPLKVLAGSGSPLRVIALVPAAA